MYAEMEALIDLGKRLAVPESAVIDTGLRQIAILDRGQGNFFSWGEYPGQRSCARVNGFVEVLEGLTAGDRVVTSANFLIDSESRLKEAVGEMSGGGHAGHQH